MQIDPYHFPPEVLGLLKDTIPLLCRSKTDVLDFFRGAGVPEVHLADLRQRVALDRTSINKFEMARVVLTRLNEQGDSSLGPRREVIKRVVEFEDFSSCWASDQLKARGLVAELRRVVDVKDSFVRMRQERDQERNERRATVRAEAARAAERRTQREDLQRRLARLFAEVDAHARGLALEKLANELFALDGIRIRESFVLRTEDGMAAEQIDGAIELDGDQYLVEIKWWAAPLGIDPVARHLVRIYGRASVGGILISASGFSPPAIAECERALTQRVIVLGELRELVLLLERDGDIATWLRAKIRSAKVDRQPLVHV